MNKNFASKLLTGIILVSIAIQATSAGAQTVPTMQSGTTGQSTSSAVNDPPYVMLADVVADNGNPRAARPSTIAEDTPVMTRAQFVKHYPQSGDAGYNRIAQSNRHLCDEGSKFMDMILEFDQQFASSDEEYAELQRIYEALPSDVKRATALMTIAQAGSTGALCALSAGLYCIAAIAGGVGNIFTSQSSKKLQLANIKLSLANIRLTRLNIKSNRLTLRLDAFWLDLVVPYCQKIFPGMAANVQGSFYGSLPQLESSPARQFNGGGGGTFNGGGAQVSYNSPRSNQRGEPDLALQNEPRKDAQNILPAGFRTSK